MSMLPHFLKLALRRHLRDRGYTLASVGGLVLGFTSAILLAAYIGHEYRYDHFHQDANLIHRLTSTYTLQNGDVHFALNEGVWDGQLETQIPGLAASTAFTKYESETVFRVGDNLFTAADIITADIDFFRVFSFPMLQGDPSQALSQPGSIVIGRAMAERLFGTSDAVGRTIERLQADQQNILLTVTGVLDYIPTNSSIRFDYVLAGIGSPWERPLTTRGRGNTMHIFFKTERPMPDAQLDQLIAANIDTRQPGQDRSTLRLNVQPLTDVYLNATNQFEIVAGGNPTQLRIFVWLCAGLVMIAAINFVNLSTAQYMRRAKEIGVRKLLGTHRGNLMRQLLTEAMLLSMTATLLSLGMALVFSESVATHYVQADLIAMIASPSFLGAVIVAGLLTGLAAGLYPAWKLSGMSGLNALKGSISLDPERLLNPRNTLVALQVVTAVTMLVLVVVVERQVQFLTHKDPGFRTDRVVVISRPSTMLESQWSVFQERITSLAGISAVGSSLYEMPGTLNVASVPGKLTGEVVTVNWNSVTGNLISAISMNLVQSHDMPTEDPAVRHAILNESAITRLGIEQPIGHRFSWQGETCEVVGVVKDFHFQPFTSSIDPVILFKDKYSTRFAYAHMTVAFEQLKPSIDAIWAEFSLPTPYTFRFLDETYAQLMDKETKTNAMLRAFTLVVLLITGIGLLGLISHAAARLRKQIGIRKVMGASVAQLVGLLTRRFAVLTAAGFALAVPLSARVAGKWLESFAYRVEVGWTDFALALLAIGLFTAAVVAFKALQAATGNPLDVIRED